MVLRISYGMPIKKYKGVICQRLAVTKKRHKQRFSDVPMSRMRTVTLRRLETILLSIEHEIGRS
jgi:hypothetical protein